MERRELLPKIPKMDVMLELPALQVYREATPPKLFTQGVRAVLEQVRQDILQDRLTQLPTPQQWAVALGTWLNQATQPSLRPVLNGTGVVLHTNLGRACLSSQAVDAVCQVAKGYSTLEYDLPQGQRGSRHSHVEHLLQELTGAEAAMVVNNNAAAVLLILSAMAKGREVPVSRGELVEIGGSFRVPEVMEQGGCILREVGTTNKTHLTDYERAIGAETALLLKVHTSNYRIIGFTESVALPDLVALGHHHGLPVVEDLGSGVLCDLSHLGIPEPTVQASIAAGVDVVCFSGDKLLGGPQAGIIVGKQQYIQTIKQHPLARAVRVDKMTLAALEATLQSYAQETHWSDIPTLSMLNAPMELLHQKATALCEMVLACGMEAEVVAEQTQVGGGSAPGRNLSTYVVAITPKDEDVVALERRLRLYDHPIIGRISKNRYYLDVRTLPEEAFSVIAHGLKGTLQ